MLPFIPFTPAGLAMLGWAAWFWAAGISGKNAYALSLAVFFSALPLGLLAAGLIQAGRLSACGFVFNTGRAPAARLPGEGIDFQPGRLPHGRARTWPFFRLHLTLRGALRPEKGLLYSVASRAVLAEAVPGSIPLELPFAGELAAGLRVTLNDVFGLSSFRLQPAVEWSTPVLPGRYEAAVVSELKVHGGEEEKSRKSASDIERYYMREYQPGDRLRDINWKASSRSPRLITRIPPDARESTRLLSVEFRHYRPFGRVSPDSLAHLDFLKSWLSSFLVSVFHSGSGFRVRVRTVKGWYLLPGPEYLEDFLKELAPLGLVPEPPAEERLVLLPGQPSPEEGEAVLLRRPADEIYVFSTPWDEGLAGALGRYAKPTIFATAPAEKRPDQLIALVRSFSALPLPGLWWLPAGAPPGRAWDGAALTIKRLRTSILEEAAHGA